MRIDKYIKLTRLIKRRGVAKVLIDEGSILVNSKKIKPSYEVKINDVINLKLGRRNVEIIVEKILMSPNKEESLEMYKIIKDELTTK